MIQFPCDVTGMLLWLFDPFYPETTNSPQCVTQT